MGNEEQESQKARVTPRGGATRCPYCHDECDPSTDVVVCRECLSRHHEGCWREGGSACSSCSATEALTPEGAEREEKTLNKLAPLAILLTGEAILFYIIFAAIIPAFREMFATTGIILPALTEAALALSERPLLATAVFTGLVAFIARSKLAPKGRAAGLALLNGGLIGFVILSLFLPLIELIEKL